MKVRRRPVEYTAVRFDPAVKPWPDGVWADRPELCCWLGGHELHVGDYIVTSPDGCRSVVSAKKFEREWEIVPDGLRDDIEARFGKLVEPA